MKKIYSMLAGALVLTALATPWTSEAVELEDGRLYAFAKTGDYTSILANQFYSFDLVNPTAATQFGKAQLSISPSEAGTYSGGKYVGIGGSYVKYVVVADCADGTWNIDSYVGLSGATLATDLTDDEGTVYGWFGSYGSFFLGTLDSATGSITKIGADVSTRLVVLTSNGSGTLYGIATDGTLYTVDKSTGALQSVGSTGIAAGEQVQSATYDSNKNVILWARYYKASMWGAAESAFYEVDPSTAAAKMLCAVPSNAQLTGLTAVKSFDATAPGEVTDFTVTTDGKSNDIAVSFTMPTKNFAGDDFHPNLRGLSYTITIDGEVVVDAQSADKGEAVSKTFTTTPGTHTVAVFVSQLTLGNGPEVKTTLFVGEDTPVAVTDLKASCSGSVVTLTWTAPVGANGGSYDASKLAYNITRNGEEVAHNYTGTSFTETINSDALVGYKYTVTTVYNEAATEYSATSNDVFVGPSFAVTPGNPYFLDFEDCTPESVYSNWFFVCDPSTYGYADPVFAIREADGNKYLGIRPENYTSNPKAFTTALALEAGHSYRLSFRFMTDGFYGATFGVDLVDSPTASCKTIRNLVSSQSFGYGSANAFVDVPSVGFNVEESGTYFICINNYFFNALWAFDDFKVEDLTSAELSEPMSVTDFKAAAQKRGSNAIDFSFTLPTADTNGNATELTKVELLRGGELVKAWTEDLVPGAAVTYTEENAPVGYHRYEVVAENAQGKSVAAVAFAQSGFDYDLAFVSAEAPEKVSAGETFSIDVTVANNGVLRAPFGEESAYTVSLVRIFDDGSTQIYNMFYGTTIESGEKKTYSFSVVADETMSSFRYYIYISYDEDENPADNRSEDYAVTVDSTTGVDGIAADGISVSAVAGKLTVAGAKGQPVAVYNAAGVTVLSTVAAEDVVTFDLADGLYIVRAGDKAFKINL